MREQVSGKLLFSAVVVLVVGTLIIGSTGLDPVSSAGSRASLLENCTPATGVVILAPYSSGYVACDLGAFTKLPAGIGGITFKHADDNNLVVATYEETQPGVLYSVALTRDGTGHIIAIQSGGTRLADAPYVSSGMAYGPGNVLFYSRSPVNELGEIKLESAKTDKVIALAPLGVTQSVSGINFVPQGFPHVGELKLVGYKDNNWYAATLSPEADGTYSIATITKKATISSLSYPTSFVYVPSSSPQFSDYSAMLVGEYYNGAISAYTLDSESNPVSASRSSFLTGLPWIKGSAIDPLTKDLIIATRGNRVIAVRGFGTQPMVPTPTPTSTSTPPPATYSISGRVMTSGNAPLAGVSIRVGNATVFTDITGSFGIGGLPAGTYTVTPSKTDYTFDPPVRSATVPPNAMLSFTARFQSRYPPVILVHGYFGFSYVPLEIDRCYPPDHWDKATTKYLYPFHQWLVNDGFDVWMAHWETMPTLIGGTPSIETNAVCLAGQIETVKQLTGQSKVILIAYDMGGLISRAYLQSTTYAVRRDVQTLITLGSAHAGIVGITLLRSTLIGPSAVFCISQPGFCQQGKVSMEAFNKRGETNIVNYYLIGGDEGNFMGAIMWPTEGYNDGMVGVLSATGMRTYIIFPTPAFSHPATRIKTREAHINAWGTSYFEPRPGQTWSQSYKCVREILLGLSRTDCPAATTAAAKVQEDSGYSASAPLQSGHISTGETINRTLPIDTTDRSIFALTWMTETLSLNLVDPNGLTIDPTYAMSNPSIVTFDSGPAGAGSPGWMSYAFTNTVPGTWTLSISAPDAGPAGTDWMATAAFASNRTFEAGAGDGLFQIGETATLTATLKSGTSGITGATVRVDLARSDSVIDTLTLNDMGGGLYQGTYLIPNAPGYLDAIFTADGNDGGTAFSRQSRQLLSIMPQTAQLTGSYADRAVDEDGFGKADALEVDVGIDFSAAGQYNLSADLRVGEQLVAQSSRVISTTAGIHTVTLRFDGGDIYNAGVDGPYLLTNLALDDLQLAVPTIMQSDLYTTAAYDYAEFQPANTLYLPLVTR